MIQTYLRNGQPYRVVAGVVLSDRTDVFQHALGLQLVDIKPADGSPTITVHVKETSH